MKNKVERRKLLKTAPAINKTVFELFMFIHQYGLRIGDVLDIPTKDIKELNSIGSSSE